MKQENRSEKGQALVLIAVAIVAIMALVGLAIDGGHTYSDRRQAQNAADAAALAAARAYANNQASSDAELLNFAKPSTTQNGYSGDGTQSAVGVTQSAATQGDATNECSPHTQGIDVHVTVDSFMPTWFAQIVGISEVHNQVNGVARACKPYTDQAVFGNAVVALSDGGPCDLEVIGNSGAQVTGSGMYTNGTFCDNGSAGSLNLPDGEIAADDCKFHGGSSHPYDCGPNAGQQPRLIWPEAPKCTQDASKSGGVWTSGNINGSQIDGGDVLGPGIYCISGDVRINANNATLTGNNVMLYFKDDNATFSFSGGDITLTAMTDSSLYPPYSNKYSGLLVYMKPKFAADGTTLVGSSQTLIINGNANTTVAGAIWAPSADLTISGTSGNPNYESQIIGWKVKIGGNTHIDTDYDDSLNIDMVFPPIVQIIR